LQGTTPSIFSIRSALDGEDSAQVPGLVENSFCLLDRRRFDSGSVGIGESADAGETDGAA
jgi:hypothetical protein